MQGSSEREIAETERLARVHPDAGRNWIPGLVPARNVGAKVAAEIESVLAELEGRQVNARVLEEEEVQRRVGSGSVSEPAGVRKPKAVTTQTTQYERDPGVKAWVLVAARGICECCGEKAPFVSSAGLPFLEVHHIRTLADGGSETVTNAAALCPNCHRRLHYGQDANDQVENLYSRLTRLVRE